MTGDSDSTTTSVEQNALDKYGRQGDSGLSGLFMLGLSDVVAATKALAAAYEAHALALDPHAIDTMLKKLTEMQDELGKIQRRSTQLAQTTPLGGGYAEEIGKFNAELSRQITGQIIPEMAKAIDELKTQIDKSRASYQNVEEAVTTTQNHLSDRIRDFT